jgi:hypothetical protein
MILGYNKGLRERVRLFISQWLVNHTKKKYGIILPKTVDSHKGSGRKEKQIPDLRHKFLII